LACGLSRPSSVYEMSDIGIDIDDDDDIGRRCPPAKL